ncbi:uncharacterized protein LOC120090219 [Benincasa hispida]|uniref:uncharacterized protein LOC120090219 n=1 Tax=Benincasa hispida TaxID=102211 RepID=UPI0019010F56|nr:uncharacterized protein LOC120090219 [Benincasa hispida]
MTGKGGRSLKSPWVSISKTWLKVEILATFKLGNGSRIAFWLDTWEGHSPFNILFSSLFRITTLPNGSVADHWDNNIASWSITFRRSLKDEEVSAFQDLLRKIVSRSPSLSFDKRVWSISNNSQYTVKSLKNHLTPFSPLEKPIFSTIWKTKSPRRVNILIWIMLFGQLNVAEVLQKKQPTPSLSPTVCPFCLHHSEVSLHLFFTCPYSSWCWNKLLCFFNLPLTLCNDFKSNVFQLLARPTSHKSTRLLWCNAVKALLADLWFERNQRIFYNKATSCQDRLEAARRQASSWCLLSDPFRAYSLSDFNLNWEAFISTPPNGQH